MAPSRPIPAATGPRRESLANLASSFAASLADAAPLAHEVVARDLAGLTPADLEAEAALARSWGAAGGGGLFRRSSAADAEAADEDGPGGSASATGGGGGHSLDAAAAHHYLYRRPSAIAFGATRPALGVASVEPPPLSRIEKLRSREAERSLLRDNNLLGGGPAAETATTTATTTTTTTTTTPPAADEQTPLLGEGAPPSPGDSALDEQFESAVAAGQIHTTWQREAKTIAVYSRSLIITFLLQYSINITGVFAVGHIGKAELGAVSLAAMTASITFYAPCQGLATCLDTLCAQAYGSGHKTLVGLQLQRMCCFLLLLCVPLAAVWLLSEPILAALVPERATAALAGLYLRVLVLSMPASAVFECAKRYMQAQGLFTANTYVLMVAAPLNILLNWLFVWRLGFGFVGAPISAAITQWTMPLMLLAYVVFVDGAACWGGFSRRALANWGPMVRLALPGMVMIEAEFFAFEILTLAAGRFGTTALAAQSILVTLTSTTYQIPFPMSIAASTRVANLVGARLPAAAKVCAHVATVAGFLIGLFNLTLVFAFRYQIPVLFTDDPDVIDLVARAIPVCACMQVFDGTSAVASALLRGVGRQEIGSYANLAAYYLVALPVSFGTAFGLGWRLPGLWFGVSLGLILVTAAEFAYLYGYDWDRAVVEAEERNAQG